jgi:hypothetical protein
MRMALRLMPGPPETEALRQGWTRDCTTDGRFVRDVQVLCAVEPVGAVVRWHAYLAFGTRVPSITLAPGGAADLDYVTFPDSSGGVAPGNYPEAGHFVAAAWRVGGGAQEIPSNGVLRDVPSAIQGPAKRTFPSLGIHGPSAP